MKFAIIGGAGARTPLLVRGLAASHLPIDEVALYDEDMSRLKLMGTVLHRMNISTRLTVCDNAEDAIRNADFVLMSIRVGGIAERAHDETVALRHGVLGQETVGAAGFAMAIRNIPPMVAYAKLVETLAPHAWIINFTNPVGMVTQAVRHTTSSKIIGICDTPTELFHAIAEVLERPASKLFFDYFGLNHLGWVRDVYDRGEPQLARLWSNPDRLQRIYRFPLFSTELLQTIKLLPTEYVYYYTYPERAIANLRQAGRSRGAQLAELNEHLFTQLSTTTDPVSVYERYLATRDGTYMQAESASPTVSALPSWATLTGYDKIALQVIDAIYNNRNDIIPLSVVNQGNMPELDASDVVEIPCVVGNNGAKPLHVGPVPPQIRDLLVQVKRYEHLTVEAALTRSKTAAIAALSTNPLVPSRETAIQLCDTLSLPW